MDDYTLFEKIKILINIVSSSPLFLCYFMIGVAVFIFFIICIKKGKKINKWIFITIWILLLILLSISYKSVTINLIDSMFNDVFMALYFPNLTVYIIIVFISNFFLFYSILSKKIEKSYKIVNVINSIIINSFLVLIIDIANTNGIDIKDTLTVYSNSNLLVLFELTTSIFTSWILLNLLISAHHKLKKYDSKQQQMMPEIIFD